MNKYDKLFENIMRDNMISTSLNYEDYKNRTDDELKAELDDLNKHDPKTFRANIKTKKQDIDKEIKRRSSKNDK